MSWKKQKTTFTYNQQFINTLDCLHIINLLDQISKSLLGHLLVSTLLVRKNNHSIILNDPR